MSAASVETASASTMDAAATAVEPTSASAVEAAASAAMEPATEGPKAGAAIEAASAIKPVEPWPRADKQAAGEPRWTVVAIGRARVRGIWIVAVGAGWRPIICRSVNRSIRAVNWADPYTHSNALRARE